MIVGCNFATWRVYLGKRSQSEPKPEVANYMQGKIKRSAAIKTIYVQDVDQWEVMRAYAEEQGMSVSECVMAGFELLINENCPKCKRIAAILATGSVKVRAKKETE
jgi:hypothetical protein